MIVSGEHQFVFVSMPRSATHTMYYVLTQHYGGVQIFGGEQPYHNVIIPKDNGDWLTWTISRNPYSRLVSMWRHTQAKPHYKWHQFVPSGTFEDYAEWQAGMAVNRGSLQPMWFRAQGIRFDKVVKYENLMEGLESLPFWSGPEALPKHSHKSEKKIPIAELLTPKAVEAVRTWAAGDFQMFGYETEPPTSE